MIAFYRQQNYAAAESKKQDASSKIWSGNLELVAVPVANSTAQRKALRRQLCGQPWSHLYSKLCGKPDPSSSPSPSAVSMPTFSVTLRLAAHRLSAPELCAECDG